MDPSQDLDREAPSHAAARAGREPLPRRMADRAVLWLHRQAERMDRVPLEFGDGRPVDREDAGALAREWLRQARLWAAYNPEEMLAMKAGAGVLGVALLFLIALVEAIR